MKKNLTLIIMLLCFPTLLLAATTNTLFDFGWKFCEGDVKGAHDVNFDDSKWQNVNLPHDWDIHHSPERTAPTANDGGYYPAGFGWYRKTFTVPEGDIVKLHFEGVYQRCEVYVNGQLAGRHAYGYTPFTVDITNQIGSTGEIIGSTGVQEWRSEDNTEASNSQPYNLKTSKPYNLTTIAVRVDNSQQTNCRWYSGSGIYRHVWLQTMNNVHIAENGVFVTTPKVSAERAEVKVEVTVSNNAAEVREAKVAVAGQEQTVRLNGGESKTVVFNYNIDNPKLWSPDAPNLYKAEVTLSENGKETDRKTVNYGVRWFTFDAENGFMLNGKKLLLNGACVHHDDGLLGAAAFDRAEIRKVRLMKEAGFNLIRTAHNPSTRALLDACDSIGMLVVDEAFDGWRQAKTKYDYSTLIDSCYKEDVAALVMRDRNHPSVISWSIGNEVMERKDIRVVTTARMLKREVLRYDTTRPVTEALCAWDSDWEIYDPHAEVLDVVGYNYMIHKHKSDHQRDPKRVMWQTESYPRDAFGNWAIVNDHPYVVGDMVWTGLDYLGESGIGRFYYEGETHGEHYHRHQFPWHGAYCGDVDITGWRKPISHYRDILWNTQENGASPLLGRSCGEVLYLAVKEPNEYYGKIRETQWSVWPTWESWNWKGWEGKPIEVEVYTKAPEVKLYLNDRLIGTKKVNRGTQYKAVFPVPYEPGTLRAEAGGKTVTLATAGEPARLRLTTDRKVIAADGQDLSFITVEVVDRQGRVVPDAAVVCNVQVTGSGTLAAAGSADLKDLEALTSPKLTTWKGRGMIVVRSKQKAGKASITVKSSLPTVRLSLNAKKNYN